MKRKSNILTLVLCVALVGCGSGSSGSGTQNTSSAPGNYTIGGTVSGLSGTGLVLEDNTGNNLPVNAGATSFTFSTGIASGGNYSVSVFSQPSTPAQTCGVTSGSGMVTNANVTSVQVACTAASVSLGNWSGSLTDGTNTLPLDFGLTEMGSVLSATQVNDFYSGTGATPYCGTVDLASVGASINKNQGFFEPPINTYLTLTGMQTGQNISLVLGLPAAYGYAPPSPVSLSLTGTLVGSVISGTYTLTTVGSGSFGSIAGTFTFTQYRAFTGGLTGVVSYGTNQISTTIGPQSLTVGVIPNLCPATTYQMLSLQVGRFVFLGIGNFTAPPPAIVWGLLTNPQASGLSGYIEGFGYIGLPPSSCFDPTETAVNWN